MKRIDEIKKYFNHASDSTPLIEHRGMALKLIQMYEAEVIKNQKGMRK